MSELRPIDRELLAVARRERTPDAHARSRVLASVLASAASTGGAGVARAAPRSALNAGSVLVKGLLLAALGVGSVSGGYFLTRASPPPLATGVVASRQQTAPSASTQPPTRSLSASPPSVTSSVPSSRSPKTAGAASSASELDSLNRELSLLQHAHAAYRAGEPHKALELSHEHARAFPRSQLAAERTTIEVLSLCALGRKSEAVGLVRKLRGASGSPSLAGLDGSCVSN